MKSKLGVIVSFFMLVTYQIFHKNQGLEFGRCTFLTELYDDVNLEIMGEAGHTVLNAVFSKN